MDSLNVEIVEIVPWPRTVMWKEKYVETVAKKYPKNYNSTVFP